MVGLADRSWGYDGSVHGTFPVEGTIPCVYSNKAGTERLLRICDVAMFLFFWAGVKGF